MVAVKLLVEAGADLHATDRMYQGTPLDWADYLQREDGVDEVLKGKYREIESYLRSQV
jgi:peptide-methionine (S)-S-oxide reductase